MTEFTRTWDYHRDFDIMHFGNPEALYRDDTGAVKDSPPEPDKVPLEPLKPKKTRFLRQPKGWFRT